MTSLDRRGRFIGPFKVLSKYHKFLFAHYERPKSTVESLESLKNLENLAENGVLDRKDLDTVKVLRVQMEKYKVDRATIADGQYNPDLISMEINIKEFSSIIEVLKGRIETHAVKIIRPGQGTKTFIINNNKSDSHKRSWNITMLETVKARGGKPESNAVRKVNISYHEGMAMRMSMFSVIKAHFPDIEPIVLFADFFNVALEADILEMFGMERVHQTPIIDRIKEFHEAMDTKDRVA